MRTSGRIACWRNQNSPASTAHQVPAALRTKTFSDIDAGWWHQTCAIEDQQNGQAAGTLHCWGNNPAIGGIAVPLGPVPANLRNLRFKKMSAGREHTCAITIAGRAHCWGLSQDVRSPVPTAHQDSRFVDIDAGQYHTCGVTD